MCSAITLVESSVIALLDWEHQRIFGTQSEIGMFPADEESLYFGVHVTAGRPGRGTILLEGPRPARVAHEWPITI